RYYKSAAGAEASTWLAERWRSFATRPGVTVQLVDHGYPQKSVVLTIPGTTRADEVIVLGGHLDSIAMGGLSANAPGADDDASGIATLTEIARALLAADYRPERTIKFIAYEAEEVGLLGSQAIVRDFKRANTDVVGALQLDMTNYQGSDKDIWLMKDFTSAAQNAFLVRLIETYTGATWGSDACGYACSDHASWTRAGVPASMPFEARMRDRNQHIHTSKDTLALSNGEATHALAFARLGAAYAIELGKGELGTGELGTGALGTGALGTGAPADADPHDLWALLALGLLAAAGLAARRAS
ncbi:MAG: M20/M25/M40 family metallo-hydrolase, partial [Kofleriaceae bacterium]